MSSYRIIGLFALLCGVTACERPIPPLAEGKEPAYDLTGYLQEQTARLQQEQPPVLKSVITKGQPTETAQMEEMDWEKELAIFQEVDLSRPACAIFIKRSAIPCPMAAR
ncbi:hypothetical protein [Pontibacter sp. BAB1700]|uniref:hypothetical protein n=1 Tax=Pontibacter sp. BAB1700 TaxID=1144253 RepID=UPI00026BD233|nr:hypothetical protein [Pontibacter sp. BAB1700]EJF09628.1 hypothetical protein O71_14001 [Pontibacter sp. BAB1700]